MRRDESASPKCGLGWRVNAIDLPSGAHEIGGFDASPGSVVPRLQVPDVRRRGVPPAAGTSQMWNGIGAALVRNPSLPTSKASVWLSASFFFSGSSPVTLWV